MFLWVYNTMNRRSKSGSVFVYLYVVVLVDMATFSEEFDMTHENLELSQGQDARKLKGKGPNK
jgi:hypothetical protein